MLPTPGHNRGDVATQTVSRARSWWQRHVTRTRFASTWKSRHAAAAREMRGFRGTARGSFPSYLRLFPIELTDVAGPFPAEPPTVYNQNLNCIVLEQRLWQDAADDFDGGHESLRDSTTRGGAPPADTWSC